MSNFATKKANSNSCFLARMLNNSSMLLESSCSEVENRKDEIHLPRERFSFSEIWTASQGLTVV